MAATRIVQVLIDGATSDLVFSYTVPEGTTVTAGQRVRVPLRNRKAVGTVISVEMKDTVPSAYQLKPILGVVAKDAFLTPGLMKLAAWIAEFYLAPIETVIRSMIPKPSRGEKEERKTAKFVELAKGIGEEVIAQFSARQARQKAAVEILLSSSPLLLRDLVEEHGIPRSSITALERANLIKVFDQVVTRDPMEHIEFVPSAPLRLNEEQALALDRVLTSAHQWQSGEKARPILLHGITGSGKTEVYLQAIQKMVEEGKGAIVLVPEIALTPQTADRFKQRFAHIKESVAILHSNLSERERHDEWRKVLDHKARIVIGARSAIFSPIQNLGLIVVDEEHENSYKQDTVPRYQARDIAVVRGQIEQCAVLLASATPSLESWQNAQTGKYELVTMSSRVDDRKLPLIRLIDMRDETRRNRSGPAILSLKLRTAMEQRLASGQQIILFLNRRGFARSILCPECGYVATCRHCSTTMVLHRKEDKLICHICGFAQLPPKICPECSSRGILTSGWGTERAEDVLRQVFPHARICRVDTDVMRRKDQLRDTLNAFRTGKIDILLGTQMIAKGLDFPNVTLVGVLNADVGLHIPDIRASERTFQLLTQVAGRAGRGELEGEVVVQTFTPHHPAIQYARHHNFLGFAEYELGLRRHFEHPPFSHLVLITSRSVHEERARFSLKTLHSRLVEGLPEGVTVSDPLPSPLVKSHDQWRFQVVLKSKTARPMIRYIRSVLAKLTFPGDVFVTVDVNPYSMS